MAEDDFGNAQLPLDSVGVRLRRARESAGLSRADISARTRVAERHLTAIEEDRFGDLASSTYAVGFSRAYARTVGLDEAAIAQDVRRELDGYGDSDSRMEANSFEPGDPARVPSSRLAWLAGLAALAVVVAVAVFWPSQYRPALSLPDLTSDAPEPAASASASAAAAAVPPAQGAVVFTARENLIWIKFYDAAGVRLMEKQMALGESYAVPAAANGPQAWTARPDAFAITVGGVPVPPLSDRQVTMKNVPISAAALLARPAPVTVASGSPPPGAAPVPASSAALPGMAPAYIAPASR